MAYKAPIWEDGRSPAISAENLNNLSQAAEGAQVLYGNSAPTSSTKGAVGQFYLVVVADSDGNYPLYQCVAIANGSYTWQNVFAISTSLASSLALSTPATIRDAIARLALSPAGTGTLYVHCKDEAGEPVSGCVVQIGEEIAVTGASGAVKYFLSPGTYSASIHSPIDYGAENQTASVTIALGETVSLDVTIQDSMDGATELRLTSSIPYAAFSARVISADVFGVGGGGSGGIAMVVSDYRAGATGGAGGKTALVENIDVRKIFVITVGSGGSKKSITAATSGSYDGSAGGTTKLVTTEGTTIMTAPGGAKGTCVSTSSSPLLSGASGGSGSGGILGSVVNGGKSIAGDSGEDGAAGKNASSSAKGGSGQGTTTRMWNDPNGELFSSAGGSAVASALSSDFVKTGLPGTGAGVGFASWSGGTTDPGDVVANGTCNAGSATTYGSGGGALAIKNQSKITITAHSGDGMQGLIAFRWEVAA